MHIITNQKYIARLLECGLLPAATLHYLTKEFEALEAALHHDDEQSFSLDSHGYRLIMLEASDRDCHLPVGPNCLSLIDIEPEYVEKIQLSDKTWLYRACLMPDNERFVLVYALVGVLEATIEQWFAQQIVGTTEEGIQ